MYTGSLTQWKNELPFVPEGVAPWLEMLAGLRLDELTPGRHELGGGNFMNVDLSETGPADLRNMEAHRQYIDIQVLLEGEENIGYQPLCRAGRVVSHEEGSDNWFYRPDVSGDIIIPMVPKETFAIFTPADGHRCLCAPDGGHKPVRKVIVKVKIAQKQ